MAPDTCFRCISAHYSSLDYSLLGAGKYSLDYLIGQQIKI